MDERAANLSIDELIRHGAFLRALARRLVADDSAADDVVQEVWLRALQRPPASGGSITGWLGKVARNLVRDRANAESARRDHEERKSVDVAGDESHALQRSEMVEAIASAFAGLPPLYRDALYLRYYEDKSPPQIAALLDCPLGTVKTRLSRGIELLRQDLEQRRRERGESLASLLAGLAAVGEHSGVSAVSLSVIGGILVMQKLLAAAMILIVCAAGWWTWGARHADVVVERPTRAAKSELAQVNQGEARSAITADAHVPVPTTSTMITRVPAGPSASIHVTDENRTALSAVQVHAVSDAAVVLLGSTDKDGNLGQQALSPSIARLVFSLAGFAVREVPPPKEDERELEVVLRRGGSISGRVVEFGVRILPPEIAPPVAGARVVAMTQVGGRGIFDRLQIGDPSIRCGVSDSSGAFSIDGLVAGEQYLLRAGARGFIQNKQNQPPTSIPVVPCEGVVVELQNAYGVSFEFVDDASGELISIADLAGGVEYGSRDRTAMTLPPGGIESFLAGLDPNLYADKRRLTILASSPEAPAEVGIYVETRLVGYESVKADAMAAPLSKAMPVVRVPIEQTASAFGTLELLWHTADETLKNLGPQQPPKGEVHLLGADGSEMAILAPMQPGVEHMLHRVPVGSYEVSVSANDRLFVYPAKDLPRKTVVVEADKPTLITVPLEQAGSIQLRLERADGSAYESELQFRLMRTAAPRYSGGYIGFSAPPYRIIALDPGTYSFDFLSPASISHKAELLPAPVVVTSGVESVVRVRLP